MGVSGCQTTVTCNAVKAPCFALMEKSVLERTALLIGLSPPGLDHPHLLMVVVPGWPRERGFH